MAGNRARPIDTSDAGCGRVGLDRGVAVLACGRVQLEAAVDRDGERLRVRAPRERVGVVQLRVHAPRLHRRCRGARLGGRAGRGRCAGGAGRWRREDRGQVHRLDERAVVDEGDRRHGAVGAESDRSVVLSGLQRERVEHAQTRVEEVPGSSRCTANGDETFHAGTGAFGEQRRLIGRAREDLHLRRPLREVEHVHLVVAAAPDGHREVVRVGDEADRALALEVRPCCQRLDRALERVDPEEPVVRHDPGARPALGRAIVVDREIDHGVRDVGRGSPHRTRHTKRASLRQRRDHCGLACAGVDNSDALARHIREEAVVERAGDWRWAVLRRARGAAACGQHERRDHRQRTGAKQPSHELANSNESYPAGVPVVAPP